MDEQDFRLIPRLPEEKDPSAFGNLSYRQLASLAPTSRCLTVVRLI